MNSQWKRLALRWLGEPYGDVSGCAISSALWSRVAVSFFSSQQTPLTCMRTMASSERGADMPDSANSNKLFRLPLQVAVAVWRACAGHCPGMRAERSWAVKRWGVPVSCKRTRRSSAIWHKGSTRPMYQYAVVLQNDDDAKVEGLCDRLVNLPLRSRRGTASDKNATGRVNPRMTKAIESSRFVVKAPGVRCAIRRLSAKLMRPGHAVGMSDHALPRYGHDAVRPQYCDCGRRGTLQLPDIAPGTL